MITFVTIPKPFTERAALAQQNAIASWLRVDPGARVLLLGDDAGVADAAGSLGAEHIPDLRRNAYGTPLLDDAFRIAARRAGDRLVCFVNADILMPPTLAEAARAVRERSDRFLVVGECWNAKVEGLLDPDAIDWRSLLAGARRRGADALDYFLYTPGLFADVPPFAIGRTVWDNWLVWRARADGALVADATRTVRPVHQDHAYAHQGSLVKLRGGPEAGENRRLAGGGRDRLYSRLDATHRLTPHGLVANPLAAGHSGETVRRAWAKLGYAIGLRRT